jgi:hypothetical protein
LRFSADGQYISGVTAFTAGFSSVVVVRTNNYTLVGATAFTGKNKHTVDVKLFSYF